MNLFYQKNFLKLLDFTPAEISDLLALAAKLKAEKKAGTPHKLCTGKNVALIFEKTSTRTRCAFEVAAADLGMHPVYLDPSGSQIGKKESIADTARVLGRMFDGIEYRGFGQEIVEDLAKYAGVPVWNGLTNEFHPTQILADFLTIQEHFGELKGKKLVYMGDARYNMGNSLMVGCAKMGMHFVACAPEAYFPDKALVATCEAIAAETGATLEFNSDVASAVKGAHVLYTDVWVSMGEPDEVWQQRIDDLLPYQDNAKAMALGYSLAGGLLAFLVMAALLYVISERQLWVVSMFGAMAHNLGQMLVARFVAGVAAIWYYLPVLLLSALVTGLFTGLCAQLVLKRLRRGARRKEKGEST